MKTINVTIRKISDFNYQVVFLYEDGTRNVLPAVMSLHTAIQIQKLFRK